MLNRIFGKNFHDYFHLFGICALAIGLPSSKVILSIASMLLLLNVLLEANFKTYWQNIKSNKLFLVLLCFWSLHIIGLLWTSDFNYAINDIRIKITLLLIPLILTIKPVRSEKSIQLILSFFVATLIVTSLFNIASFLNWVGNKSYTDIRELSQFGSHIRYGILIAIGAGITLYYLWRLENRRKWLLLPVFIWFCYYTYYSQIISGLIALVVIIFTFILFLTFKKSKVFGMLTGSIAVILLIIPLYFLFSKEKNETKLDYKTIEDYTPYGNLYSHYLDESTFENGKPVFAYVCEEELKEGWQKVSKMNYDSLDRKGQPLRFTLMRYMTSKNLRKDGKDFLKLTPEDIRHVENGIAMVEETNPGLMARLNGIKFQIHHSVDPNGHSLLQRIEYWKTGWQIIRSNWLLGVGTGDVQNAFNLQYQKMKSPLFEKNRLRAHNSYLTSWITFGIFGFIIFIFLNFSFLFVQIKRKNFIGIMFIAVAMCTFLIEDTLETQMGVTFFAFFYGLFSPKMNSESKEII